MVPLAMADTNLVATLIESTTSKIQELQQAFAELESYRSVSLNVKWKELEEHFHGLERSLKKRFEELKDQEKQYETKVSQAREMLKKKEATVVAKERACLKRLQEKRDVARADIEHAFKRRKKSHPEHIPNDVNSGEINKNAGESRDFSVDKADWGNVVPVHTADATNVTTASDVKNSQLMKFCEEMDASGLHKYISDNRKNLDTIRDEIPKSLRRAPNPFHLILSSLKDFYNSELSTADGKKDVVLLGVQRTCVMLMESLSVMLADGSSVSDSDNHIAADIKTQAKVIAAEWKPKLGDLELDASSGNSLEVHAFLQLLATFDVASDFDQDEICRLIPYVSRRRQIVDLCQSLRLTQRMPGVIDMLINSGRHIDAVNLASAFGLTSQFSPVPLLETYLKESKKSQVKSGSASPGAQNEDFEKELHAVKAVIKCIEEHKLEEQYPINPLQKRLVQLEKAKADKKRATEVAKSQPKRPRANGTNPIRNGCGYSHRVPMVPEKSFYRSPERYPYVYECQYVPQPEAHASPVRSPPYAYSPGHGNYYGNGYQYHPYYQTPYIH